MKIIFPFAGIKWKWENENGLYYYKMEKNIIKYWLHRKQDQIKR